MKLLLVFLWAVVLSPVPAVAAGPTSRPDKPLAGLPAKEGPHIAKIRALPSDSWLDLGQATADLKWGAGPGRAWCAHMNYAAGLRGAFHTGEGVHAYVRPDGYYMDDLFFYDLNSHAWICVYPGTKAGDDQGLRLNDDGLFLNQAGELTPVAQLAHNYGGTTYDSDRNRFVIVPKQVVANWWSPSKLKQVAELTPEAKKRMAEKAFSPWFYNPAAGKFERDLAQGPWPTDGAGRGALTFYLPTIKKVFFRDSNEKCWLYDPENKSWSKIAATPSRPLGTDMVACYDSKRDRILVPGNRPYQPKAATGPDDLFAYDVKAEKWIDLAPKGDGRSTDENSACVTYDATNDVVIFAMHREGPGRGLYVYDPVANAWLNDSPKPLPGGFGRGTVSAFYDPVNNAHYYYAAGDSSPKGTFWVYRYKQASGSSPK